MLGILLNRRTTNPTAAIRPALLEPLEGRQLMSAITPALAGASVPLTLTYNNSTLPGAQVAGGQLKGKVQVTLNNPSTVDDKGTNRVTVYASTDGTIDPTADRILGTAVVNGNLRAGKSKTVNINVAKQAAPITGTYRILIGGTDASGDALAQGEAPGLTVAAANVALTAALGAPSPTAVVLGKRFKINATLTNTGNVDSKGQLSIAIGLSQNGQTVNVPLASYTRNVTLKLGSKTGKTFTFNVKVPTTADTGTYTPVITFTQGSATPARAFSNTPITVGSNVR